MSVRDTSESECIDTTQKTGQEQTDLQLIADLLTQNGMKTTKNNRRDPPQLGLEITKTEVEGVRALIREAQTEHQYRIITPEDTTALRSWPTSESEVDQKRTVFITPDNGFSFTPRQKDILREAHL